MAGGGVVNTKNLLFYNSADNPFKGYHVGDIVQVSKDSTEGVFEVISEPYLYGPNQWAMALVSGLDESDSNETLFLEDFDISSCVITANDGSTTSADYFYVGSGGMNSVMGDPFFGWLSADNVSGYWLSDYTRGQSVSDGCYDWWKRGYTFTPGGSADDWDFANSPGDFFLEQPYEYIAKVSLYNKKLNFCGRIKAVSVRFHGEGSYTEPSTIGYVDTIRILLSDNIGSNDVHLATQIKNNYTYDYNDWNIKIYRHPDKLWDLFGEETYNIQITK